VTSVEWHALLWLYGLSLLWVWLAALIVRAVFRRRAGRPPTVPAVAEDPRRYLNR
jgi:hypothetical protein